MGLLSDVRVFESFPFWCGGPAASTDLMHAFLSTPNLVRANVGPIAIDPHPSPFSMKFALSGEQRFSFGKRHALVNSRAGLLVPPGTQHGSQVRDHCHSLSLQFPAELLREATALQSEGPLGDRPESPDCLDFPVHAWLPEVQLRHILKSLARTADPLEIQDLAASALELAAGRVCIARRQMARVPAKKASVRRELFRRLTLARTAIDQQPEENWTLGRLAATAIMSEFHFHRCFLAAFGMSPGQYIRAARIRRAKELLSSSRISVTRVASEVGFENLSSFIRSFRLSVGATPNQFRKLAA